MDFDKDLIDEDFEPVIEKDSNVPSLEETIDFEPLSEEKIDEFFSLESANSSELQEQSNIEQINEVLNETTPIIEENSNSQINKEQDDTIISEKPVEIIEEKNDDTESLINNQESSNNIFENSLQNDENQEKQTVKDIALENKNFETTIEEQPNILENNTKIENNQITPDVFPEKQTEQIASEENESNNIFESNSVKLNNDSFSAEFNKLKEEQEILNMNDELKLDTIIRENPYKKYMALLPIFAFFFTSFLGIYLFTVNTNAEGTNLIKIEKNNKVGYIDESGNSIVNAKYFSGTEFYKGFAIVKNQNNLSAIINGKGNLESSFGDYFYIERYNNRYVASKFTSNGLKLALLDSNLKELTRYKYDNITYVKNDTFLYTKDDTMGVLNKNGKEVYSYTVDEVDNKNISIEVSKVDSGVSDRYAKIKVNNSSTIINLLTGEEVYKYTLDDIYVLENNVFYLKTKNNENYRYIVIRDNSISYETNNYKNVKIDNYKSNILIGIKDNSKIDYINLNDKKIINDNENIDYVYGDGIILQKMHDFSVDKDIYTISNSNKVLGKFENIKPVTGKYSNNLLKVYVNDDKYNFVNTKGNLINNESYDTADEFNEFGYSIVSKNNYYGVVNAKGDEVIKLDYDKIEYMNDDLFKTMRNKYEKDLFIYYKNGKCGILNSKGDVIISSGYDKFKYITTSYPMIIGKTESESTLINLDIGKDMKINASKDTSIYDNYIIDQNKYYNYDGKLIFDKSKEG